MVRAEGLSIRHSATRLPGSFNWLPHLIRFFSRMRTQVECVSGASPRILSLLLDHILKNTDSIGLNEQELGIFIQALEEPKQRFQTVPQSSPVALVQDAPLPSRMPRAYPGSICIPSGTIS